jgi:hypothetical protein
MGQTFYNGIDKEKYLIDSATDAVNTVDYSHHEIHSGDHYFIADFTSLDTAGTIEFIVTTPDTTKWGHLVFSVQGTNQTEIDVYEACVETGDGTAITPVNNNRNSSNTSGLVVKYDPTTISDDGTRLSGQKFGVSGTPVTSRGGDTRRDDELNLKQNTKYLIRVTSLGDGNVISYRASWYEHTNKI